MGSEVSEKLITAVMSAMQPLLANAIDFGMVFSHGLTVLVPLVLFQVGVEALVLRRIWRGSFEDMARFTFRANCWSLAAGIPTKISNLAFYDAWLPRDLPGFFARYPFAVGVGTLAFFVVTLLVELACASRWRRLKQPSLATWALVNGILLANLATYAVLAPIHYYATLPTCDVREFTSDTRWPDRPETQVVFVDSNNGHLKIARLDGSAPETIVPMPVKDYLISPDAGVCLFRRAGGALLLHRRATGESRRIWQTDERFNMNQVAFSPSAERVAFASEAGGFLEVVDVRTTMRVRQKVEFRAYDLHVAWSPEEATLFVSHSGGNRFEATLSPEFTLSLVPLSRTNEPALLPCFGRVGGSHRSSGALEWGRSFPIDHCGNLRAWAVMGLTHSLRIYRDDLSREKVFIVAANPGLMRLGGIRFNDVAFLDGCHGCVFDSEGTVYLLDLERKRLATVAKGERFILMTPRYQKRF